MHELQQRLYDLDKYAGELAKAEADLSLLEHGRHALLARLMKEAQDRGVTAINAQERDARASSEYRAHIEGLAVAVEKHRMLQCKYKNRHAMLSAWQTIQSNKRAEASLAGKIT